MSARRLTPSWLASPPPPVALEIGAGRIAGVAVTMAGGQPVVSAHAVERFDAGLIDPSLNAANIHDEAAVTAIIGRVLASLGTRTTRVALVLPDSVAKVSLVRFEKVPARTQDLEQLIRWQVRKAAPFRIEDAQVSWQPALDLPGGGREYLVTVARRDIIERYEQVCAAAGVHAGLVDLATFNQINAVLAGGDIAGDWLLVNMARDYASIALVRGGHVIFFRNRSTEAEGDLADLVHQTAMYHEDRLGGGGFSRIVLAGASVVGADEAVRFRRGLSERLGGTMTPIDVRPGVGLRDRIAADEELLDLLAAPVGILVRERAAPGQATATEVA